MSRLRPPRDTLLTLLEKRVKEMLEKDDLAPSEKLKAIEIGAKLLMVRHKVTDEERAPGAFFHRE